MGLKKDGSIVAWGGNSWGQSDVPPGNSFAAVSAGGVFSLALKTDGSIVGWGNNPNGDSHAYFLAEPGISFHGLSAKGGYELLTGNGRRAFQSALVPQAT